MSAALGRARARHVVGVAVLAALMPASGVAAGEPEADATVATVIMTVSSGSVGLVPGTVPVTFSGGCLGPYVDTSRAVVSGPPCGNVATTSSGTYTYVACTTGVLTGSASLVEPSGDSVAIQDLRAVFVDGVGVIVASSADDGSTGTLIGVGLLTPLVTTMCGPPGEVFFGMTVMFAGGYGLGA